MLDYLKYSIIVVFSFVLSMELLSVLSFADNLLEGGKEISSLLPDPSAESIVFIGDSYAATNYAKDRYVDKFEPFFKEKNYHFIDLSRPGTELKRHTDLLDSINITHANSIPKLVIYYYNISDVVSLENGKMSATAEERVKSARPKNPKAKSKKNKSLIAGFLNDSATLKLSKDILHRISIFFIDRPFPGTPASSFTKLNLKYKEELRQIFNSIEAEHLIILVNTRFNFGTRMREWEHYEVFKNMELNDNITLVQSIDIIPDDEHALSWRNGHPDQKAIDIIAERIMTLADERLAENE